MDSEDDPWFSKQQLLPIHSSATERKLPDVATAMEDGLEATLTFF